MAGINKMYDSLKTEYIKAENELKSVDQNLKKLIGTDSFDKNLSNSRKPDTNRNKFNDRNQHFEEDRRYNRSNEMISRKRRLSDSNSRIFSRLDKKFDDGDRKRPSLQSTIVTTKSNSVKVKEENVTDKEPDKKNDTRNRRMFGMIMGTLQKFQNEESQRKTITTKREQIEKKLDKADAEEKEAVKKEKISLIKTKKTKQTKLRGIEEKMERVEIHQQWEKSMQHLPNFIQTKAKPHIFYMPVKLTTETEKKLKDTKDKYLLIQAEKRAKIQKEIEDLNKKEKEENQSSKDEDDNENNLEEDDKSSKDKEIKKIKLNDTITNSDGEINDNELKNDKENKTDLNKDSQINNENKQDNDELNNKDNKINNQLNNNINDTFNDDLNKKEFLNDNKSNNDSQFNSSKHNLINSENDIKLKEQDKTKQTNEKILNEEFEPIYDE